MRHWIRSSRLLKRALQDQLDIDVVVKMIVLLSDPSRYAIFNHVLILQAGFLKTV